jgi:hypothetical protein
MLKVGLGISSFKEMIQSQNYYADKTLLIKHLIDLNDKITLITRPRRFGKTLNLDMVGHFFSLEHKDDANLFHNLKIWGEDPIYREHQGRYPTIFLSFKDQKNKNFSEAYGSVKATLAKIYGHFEYLLESAVLSQAEKKIFRDILEQTGSLEQMFAAISFLQGREKANRYGFTLENPPPRCYRSMYGESQLFDNSGMGSANDSFCR